MTTVLVVDDEPAVRLVTEKALGTEGHEVLFAETCSEALDIAKTSTVIDVAFVDKNLPDGSGLDIVGELKSHQFGLEVLLITADPSMDSAIEALKVGASDYITKPFEGLNELRLKVRSALEKVFLKRRGQRLLRDLRENNRELEAKVAERTRQLETLTLTDDVTGLYNQRFLYQRLPEELDRAKRYLRPLSVLMLDVDYFKRINDTHDHLFGSRVLRRLGEVLRSGVRAVDLVIRYGGDEFTIILPEADLVGAAIAAERLRESVEAADLGDEDDPYRVTVSIGCASALESETSTAEGLLRSADHAMYTAKRGGRNLVGVMKGDSPEAVRSKDIEPVSGDDDVPGSEAKRASETGAPSDTATVEKSSGKYGILIVDDESVVRKLLSISLRRANRSLLFASDGAQALLEIERNGPVAIALVDKNLPDRSGLEVARELKLLQPDIEIILLTGYASVESAIEAVQIGAFDYVQKPFDIQSLNLKVQNAIEKVMLSRKARRLQHQLAETGHEINNVLQVAMAEAQCLSFDSDDSGDETALQTIVDAVRRAGRIVSQLSQLSGRRVAEVDQLNINRVVEDTARFVSRTLGEKVELETHLQPNVWPARIGCEALEQVLVNLALNARDAMPNGGRLSISTSNLELSSPGGEEGEQKAGRYVCLEVSDTGTGMSDDTKAHIFDPFFTTKDPAKGSGIGLAVIQRVVREVGGHVRVLSQPGRGTTFRITLPATPSPEQGSRHTQPETRRDQDAEIDSKDPPDECVS